VVFRAKGVLQQALDLLPVLRIDVQLARNVLHLSHHFFGRAKAVYSGRRWIHAQVTAARRALKDALRRVFKNIAITLFAFGESLFSKFPLRNVHHGPFVSRGVRLEHFLQVSH
jgi:hypothetical protein